MGSAILAKLIRRDAVRAAMSAAVGAEVREAAKGGSFPQIGDHTTRTAGTGLSRICGVGLAPARGSAGPGPARRADTPRTNTHNARKALAYTAGVKYSTPILTRSLRFPPQSRILPRPCPPRDPSPARRSALGGAFLRDLPAGWPPLPAAADYRWPPMPTTAPAPDVAATIGDVLSARGLRLLKDDDTQTPVVYHEPQSSQQKYVPNQQPTDPHRPRPACGPSTSHRPRLEGPAPHRLRRRRAMSARTAGFITGLPRARNDPAASLPRNQQPAPRLREPHTCFRPAGHR